MNIEDKASAGAIQDTSMNGLGAGMRNPHQSLLIGHDRNDRSVISPVSTFFAEKWSEFHLFFNSC